MIDRLMNLAHSEHANVVIAPSANYFEPGDISTLVKITDVICADTGPATRSAVSCLQRADVRIRAMVSA
ncbi:hypothetical protein [Nocardia seriolae]|uniref:Uncharacterized protein n=1 Tax=Nocardia seriolae TaxID=37332 RepID=A0ABC9Z617_9NOCA|nr:hypothetical protein [Nocardia seriolae]APA96816.1 hypothetical protein NS506_02756 [Nocardia seriolae]OJF82046.1 hypothetical protein NS14008_26360 [Nocardia seriolae]PSK26807.1 hypothetical protein C6575_35265 [Nocardia seriolae]QOW33866.1 hypothetical protein IMZ23_01485 [Nocardia seriolae]QUN18638.1 hypothetical protein KEC46_04240 [Nocardia seriolae]